MKAVLIAAVAACAGLAGCAFDSAPGVTSGVSYGYPYNLGNTVYTQPGYTYGQPGYTYTQPGYVYGQAYPAYGAPVYTPPNNQRRNRDRDGDGIPNRMDDDRDGDGVPNHLDAYPNNPRRQ